MTAKKDKCALCSHPIFSVREAVAETDLPPDTDSASAIRVLWARTQRSAEAMGNLMTNARYSAASDSTVWDATVLGVRHPTRGATPADAAMTLLAGLVCASIHTPEELHDEIIDIRTGGHWYCGTEAGVLSVMQHGDTPRGLVVRAMAVTP